MSQTPTLDPRPPATPNLMTAEEFAVRYGGDSVELVRGEVRFKGQRETGELQMPFVRHGFVCANLVGFLTEYLRTSQIGRVMCNDSFIRTTSNPESVRGADICFFSFERLPKGPIPDGILPIVPELVAEVKSPSDRWPLIVQKTAEYLDAGVTVVVVVDEATRTALVYRSDMIQTVFRPDQNLAIPDVLPGFSMPVGKLFE